MKRILIIDDHENVCEELQDRIEAMGHEAESVGSRNGALEIVDRDDFAFDLILLDLEIPVRSDGPTRKETGLNLLDQLVSRPGAPPIAVITSHGKGHHELCRDVMQRGAAAFVTKPFDEDPPEEQIRRILDASTPREVTGEGQLRRFEGGELHMHETHAELNGIDIGCRRATSIIRRVITILAPPPGGRAPCHSGKTIAEMIGDVDAATVTAAIREFRNGYTEKMRAAGWLCESQAVIETKPGGGYHFHEAICVRLGTDQVERPQVELDAEEVFRVFRRHQQRTYRQLRDAVSFTALRLRGALEFLTEANRLRHVSGSGSTTTYEPVASD